MHRPHLDELSESQPARYVVCETTEVQPENDEALVFYFKIVIIDDLVLKMEIKPIKNERDYRKALKEIDGLMDAWANTAEGDRLNVLVTLVEAWEEKHWPIDLPDPV